MELVKKMCEMFKSMNREMMDLEVDDSCAVSGCNNKSIKSVIRGHCSVPVCKEHKNIV